LIKQTSLLILTKAIREASKGNTFFSPSIAKRLRDKYQESRDGEGENSEDTAKLRPAK